MSASPRSGSVTPRPTLNQAIKQIKIVELISSAVEEGHTKIGPDVLVTGGGSASEGLMGIVTKLLPGVDISGLRKKPGPPGPEKP